MVHAVDKIPELMNLQDFRGNTCLHTAIYYDAYRGVREILKNHPEYANVKNKEGKTVQNVLEEEDWGEDLHEDLETVRSIIEKNQQNLGRK